MRVDGPRAGRLAGPVDVALARADDTIPVSMPGGVVHGLKWDGYRAVVTRSARGARIWSRQGVDLSTSFPELVDAAVRQVPAGYVLDGEVVILDEEQARTDFTLLGRRLGAGPRAIAVQRREHPATWIGFDILAVAGTDVRPQPLRTRLQLLQELAAGWSPPLQLCPTTTDHATAVSWMSSWASTGVEGIVSKALDGRYIPGSRDWIKCRHRSSAEIVIGGLVGRPDRPSSIIGGRYDSSGRLRIVARSTPLPAAAAAALADALSPARAGHPWPDTITSHRFGDERTTLVRVDPIVVAEILVDPALDHGSWRHPVRYQRLRPDLTVNDVPMLIERTA